MGGICKRALRALEVINVLQKSGKLALGLGKNKFGGNLNVLANDRMFRHISPVGTAHFFLTLYGFHFLYAVLLFFLARVAFGRTIRVFRDLLVPWGVRQQTHHALRHSWIVDLERNHQVLLKPFWLRWAMYFSLSAFTWRRLHIEVVAKGDILLEKRAARGL